MSATIRGNVTRKSLQMARPSLDKIRSMRESVSERKFMFIDDVSMSPDEASLIIRMYDRLQSPIRVKFLNLSASKMLEMAREFHTTNY